MRNPKVNIVVKQMCEQKEKMIAKGSANENKIYLVSNSSGGI